jgi:hypothetical protein
MAKLITVRSTIPTKPDGGNVVALYEAHEDHPDGEAYVAGPAPVKVARTGQVHRLISDGTLEEVEEVDEAEKAPPSAPSSVQAPPGPPQTQESAAPTANGSPVVTDAQRAALSASGFETAEQIRAATDEQLLAVPGIGPQTLERLREATKES